MISKTKEQSTRLFPDVITTDEEYKIKTIFARLLLIKYENSTYKILMQTLENNMLVFPGGKGEQADGDAIEALVRELREETWAQPELLRIFRKSELLHFSHWFFVDWGDLALNRDVNFILAWHKSYSTLATVKDFEDDEIATIGWFPLSDMAKGKYDKQLYPNVKIAISICQGKLYDNGYPG